MISTFAFDLSSRDFNRLDRTRSYNFAEIQKAQDHPGLQSIGKDMEEITISGSLTTLRSGIDPLDDLYTIADQKDPVPFVMGYGVVVGDFLITKISEGKSIFLDDGVHIQMEFSIDLKKVYL
ncbi:MAG: phage tail protein [Pseudomonadota bacterium]